MEEETVRTVLKAIASTPENFLLADTLGSQCKQHPLFSNIALKALGRRETALQLWHRRA